MILLQSMLFYLGTFFLVFNYFPSFFTCAAPAFSPAGGWSRASIYTKEFSCFTFYRDGQGELVVIFVSIQQWEASMSEQWVWVGLFLVVYLCLILISFFHCSVVLFLFPFIWLLYSRTTHDAPVLETFLLFFILFFVLLFNNLLLYIITVRVSTMLQARDFLSHDLNLLHDQEGTNTCSFS